MAIECRKELLKNKISTKILPEAYTWHFASEWSHIKELNKNRSKLKKSFKKSKKLIERSVSIPIFVKMKKDFPKLIFKSINKTL